MDNKTVKKSKHVEYSIKKYVTAKTSKKQVPFTKKQFENIQRVHVNNMIKLGKSASDIHNFIKQSNVVKRSIGKPLNKQQRQRFGNFLNSLENRRVDYNTSKLSIDKVKYTQLSKMFGAKYDKKDIDKLVKSGLVNRQSLKLINLRNKNNTKPFNPNQVINSKGETIGDIFDIISSFSRPDIYITDIKRIAREYLGIEIEGIEDINKLLNSKSNNQKKK